jgi:nicotinamide-nucleotide amidase
MEHLMENAFIPYLRRRLDLRAIIKARVIHTAGVGESQIDVMIGELELLNNPTVSLAAFSGQVDVRITAKSESAEEAEKLLQGIFGNHLICFVSILLSAVLENNLPLRFLLIQVK